MPRTMPYCTSKIMQLWSPTSISCVVRVIVSAQYGPQKSIDAIQYREKYKLYERTSTALQLCPLPLCNVRILFRGQTQHLYKASGIQTQWNSDACWCWYFFPPFSSTSTKALLFSQENLLQLEICQFKLNTLLLVIDPSRLAQPLITNTWQATGRYHITAGWLQRHFLPAPSSRN